MKVGVENRTQLIIAVVLGIFAIVFLWRWISPSNTRQPASAPARSQAAPPRRSAIARNKAAATDLDPMLRLDLLRSTEQLKYTGKGRDIFSLVPEIPKPVVPVIKKPVAQVPTVYTPPPPPPINLKFFGFASRTGQQTKIFLSQGESVFVAAEGDIVARRYKVLKIMPNAVEIEDILNNNRQSIPLSQS